MISFDEFVKKSEELKKYKNSILKLIDEFIKFFVKENNYIFSVVDEFDFTISNLGFQ